MSRPWQFSDDSARSPFDRQAVQQPAQPPSFKTNVNRAKTKKWTEAKNYTYDGDDWGEDYDPYNEYGNYDNDGHEQESAAAPLPSASALKHRKNSFDAGDEQRSFSAGQYMTPQKDANYESQSQPSSAPRSAQDGKATRGPYDIRRDFTQPAHVPPPLAFKSSPAQAPMSPPQVGGEESPAGAYYPPRKSSLSGSPAPAAMSTEQPSSPTPKSGPASGTDKPLPFVRPSDIYKRMEEEREKVRRASDASRPSIDSSQGRPLFDSSARGGSQERRPSYDAPSQPSGRRPSLGPVAEGSEPGYGAQSNHGFQGFAVDNPILARAIGADVASDPVERGQATSPPDLHVGVSGQKGGPEVAPVSTTLPQVSRVASAFGPDFWGASGLSERLRLDEESQTSAGLATGTGPELIPSQSESSQKSLEHQPSLGFRSVVHQAFDRKDDSSVPPTPISRDNSQSQNGSETAGISPIMSRVPSTANADSRARAAEARDASVPPIAEESSRPTSPTSKSTPSHSRHTSAEGAPASFTPGYRRSLDPPSQGGSPAKTPELEYTKRLSQPMVALSTHDLQPTDTDPTKPPPTDYASREVDLADDASSPDKSTFGVAQAAHTARTQFLQTHSPTLTSSPTFPKPGSRATSPISGRQSPGTNRVRELAGKYDEKHALSRSNSSLSSHSKNSVQSWERSDENLPLKRAGTFDSMKSERDELDVPQSDKPERKEAPVRPDAQTGPSFRPHLPGEWVSYVSTAETANGNVGPEDNQLTPRKAEVASASHSGSPDTPRPIARSLTPIDLTPSTVKQKLVEKDLSATQSSPIDAVKAAGDALGTALMTSMGLGGGHDTQDFANPGRSVDPQPAEQTQRPSVGDVYLRPLESTQAASSAGSSVAPTPPPKDTPKGLVTERSSGYFPRPVLRVESDTYSTDDSPGDMESDRLRKEIELSLTQQSQSLSSNEYSGQNLSSQAAPSVSRHLGDAPAADTLLPDHTGQQPVSVPSVQVASAVEPTPEVASNGKPSLLNNRFSWEKRGETAEPLFATEDTEPRMPYERPMSSQGLHIVNTNLSSDSDSTTASPIREVAPTPIPETHRLSSPAELDASPLEAGQNSKSVSPNDTPEVHFGLEDQSRDASALPSPAEQQPHVSGSIAEKGTGPLSQKASHTSMDTARIPPFREILALKSTPERISKYNDTRTQFATMDTGLSSWLSTTLAANPEHSQLAKSGPSPGLTTSNTAGSARQKTGPSIMKIARNLAPSRDGASTATSGAASDSAGPQRQASTSQSGAERMQAKGKDFMKTAGVFGGKASVGAKGLFAKAKGRLREGGGEKASPSSRPKNSRRISEPLEHPSGRSSTPSALAAASADLRSTNSNKSQSATQRNNFDLKDEGGLTDSQNLARSPSRSGSRLSKTFSRLREGSQTRTRPPSIALSPIENDSMKHSTAIASSPSMMSPAESIVAPWTDSGIQTPERFRIGNDGRIGLLPSPALDTSMTLLGQDEDANTERPEANGVEVPAEDSEQVDANVTKHMTAPGHESTENKLMTKSTVGTIGALEAPQRESQAVAEPTSSGQLSTDAQIHSQGTAAPGSVTDVKAMSTNPSPSLFSPIGSVVRSPQARPATFSDIYPLDTQAAPERVLSPVSSLGADAQEELERGSQHQGVYLERVVSPVQDPAMVRGAPPMQSFFPSPVVEADEHDREPQDPLLYEGRNGSASERPQTERKNSRSSLPSQQRPALDSRRTSLVGWGSRRPSQVLEPATEGVATPHFESRNNSIERFAGYADSPIGQRAVPMAHQGSYFPPDELAFSGASEVSRGPFAEYAHTDSTIVVPASSGVHQYEDPSAMLSGPSQSDPIPSPWRELSMTDQAMPHNEHSQHIRNGQYPLTVEAPPLTQGRLHYVQPVSANAPPLPSQDFYPRPAPAAVFDPKQQPAEYQPPGPESARHKSPSGVVDGHQSTIDDGLPTPTQDKRDKRKSGIFRAFSRTSSISDGWQSRLPSRGSTAGATSAGNVNSKQQQTQGHGNAAVLAAQSARENTARANTLKKMQRSSTSASVSAPDPEKKANRFSRLGSIFGRRNSQAGTEAKRGNRLVKPMPQSQSQAKAATPVQNSRDDPSVYNASIPRGSGNLPSPPHPEVQAKYRHQRGIQPQQDIPPLPAAWTAPPPGGWYAPSGRPSSYTEQERQQQQQQQQREPTLPFVQPPGAYSPQQSTRRLHSEGFRREPRYMTSSPGPDLTATSTPRDRYYANGGQVVAPGAQLPDLTDSAWEQTVPPSRSTTPRAASSSAPQPIPSQPQQQWNAGYARPSNQRPLSGSWQRQSSYGSDMGYHFDNFSSNGTPPSNNPIHQAQMHKRHSSNGSDTAPNMSINTSVGVGGGGGGLNLTPTHSRTASFGAAPKTAYRMSGPMEGEQMLQRSFEQSLTQAQTQDVVYYTDRGAYPIPPHLQYQIQSPPFYVPRAYEPNSANSSPYRKNVPGSGERTWYPQQQRTAPPPMTFSPSGPSSPQQQQRNPVMAPPGQAGSARPLADNRAGSRRNSINMVAIDEDHPFTDPGFSQGGYSSSPARTSSPIMMPQSQAQAQSYYNTNAERRRMERRESAGPPTGGVGYALDQNETQRGAGWNGGYGLPAQY